MPEKNFYASAKRDPQKAVFLDFQQVADNEYIHQIFDALPDIAALLNEHRQIIFANNSLLGFLNLLDNKQVIGLRPGEAMHCVNSNITTGGCGTAEGCRYCGAVNAILDSQDEKKQVSKECRISTSYNGVDESLDLKVTATPFPFKSKTYTILSIEDISDLKRRKLLERLFFHDILNIAGSIKGFADILKDSAQKKETIEHDDVDQCIDVMGKLSNELLEEIITQRTLLAAESGDLVLRPITILSSDILTETASYLDRNDYSTGKTIVISPESENVTFWCDRSLLKRVVINMLKNALEASLPEQVVTLKSFRKGDFVVFSVHNDMVMSDEVQLQIFQRTFSTKGHDRGIGTYSIKLLTERYLKGKVGFVSAPKVGTTFFAKIPL